MRLYKSKNWEVQFIEYCQEFPGYCLILSDKHSLSELTSEEWMELGLIEKELERICKKVFNTTMYNFACLMNDAYKDNKTPYVHFHFVPRYKEKLILFNKTYIDKHFGYNFWRWKNYKFKRQKDIFTENERIKIYEMMKQEFKLKGNSK